MKAVYSHPDYLTYMHIQLICRVHHEKCKAQNGIKIVRTNINNLRYADDTTLMAKKLRGTKEPLDEGEREE